MAEAKTKIPKNVLKVLKEIKDPHTLQPLIDAGMLQDIKISGKTVSMKLVPPGFGCAACGFISQMVDEIKSAMKKQGYEAEIEVGFK